MIDVKGRHGEAIEAAILVLGVIGLALFMYFDYNVSYHYDVPVIYLPDGTAIPYEDNLD